VRPVAIVGGIVLVLVGAAGLFGAVAARESTSTAEYASAARVIVDASNGSVDVVAADVAAITVERSERYTFGRPERVAEVVGDTLELGDGCGGSWIPLFRVCEVDFVVTVPVATTVEVNASNGAVAVSGVEGDVRVDTSNGGIDLTAVAGDVIVDTSNGSIDGIDLRATRVDADTSNGSVTLTFQTAPDSVRVDTSNGRVVIEVPEGVYRVAADTSNGDVDVEVPTDPAADRIIEVETSNGDIDVRLR
jgi:hypothetical protein